MCCYTYLYTVLALILYIWSNKFQFQPISRCSCCMYIYMTVYIYIYIYMHGAVLSLHFIMIMSGLFSHNKMLWLQMVWVKVRSLCTPRNSCSVIPWSFEKCPKWFCSVLLNWFIWEVSKTRRQGILHTWQHIGPSFCQKCCKVYIYIYTIKNASWFLVSTFWGLRHIPVWKGQPSISWNQS